MQARVGDHLVALGNHVGVNERQAEILEVRGADGGPPYLVRWEEGNEALVFPGPDTTVERGSG